jgi:hypothetical protein
MIVFWWSPHTILQHFESCKHICRRLHRPLNNRVMTLQRFNQDCEGREASLAVRLQLSIAAAGHSAFTTCLCRSNAERVHSMVRLGSAEHKTATRRCVQEDTLVETTRAEREDDLLCMCNHLGTVWHLQMILQEQSHLMWEARSQNGALAMQHLAQLPRHGLHHGRGV